MNTMSESWQRHPSYLDYVVSNRGQIASLKYYEARLLKPQLSDRGYLVVNLRKNNKGFKRPVHQLVLETYVGFCPNGQECSHLDENKLNNSLDNLEWWSKAKNVRWSYLCGRRGMTGENNPIAKLTESDVLSIRESLMRGITGRDLAIVFGVSAKTISNIKLNRAWKEV